MTQADYKKLRKQYLINNKHWTDNFKLKLYTEFLYIKLYLSFLPTTHVLKSLEEQLNSVTQTWS